MNGPPQKPTSALLVAELAAHDPDRFEDRPVRLGRRADVSTSARRDDRLPDDRPDAFDELDVDAHAEHRRHDVREEHGGVDAVPPHGLQRDLGAQLRRARDFEERVALADRAVLGQRTPGLAHEPHGRALDRLAPRGAHEKRLRHGAYTSPAMNASGPLVARWRTLERAPVEAGALQLVTVEVENAGTAAWRTRGIEDGLFLCYHWLDERGNPIVWDGLRTPLERTVEPGETLRQTLALRAPIPPGRYRLAVDLVEEHRFWLAELGVAPLEEDVDVRRATRARRGFLPDAPSRPTTGIARARELHEEGYSAVGGAIEASAVAGACAVRARRRPAPALPASARLPVASPGPRAERRGGGPSCVSARTRRAVDVRRPPRAQTSIAIWSSTLLNTSAPSASATAHATTR